MSYNSIAEMAQSDSLIRRITACAAKENKPNPTIWAREQAWPLAASPGWAEAWDYVKGTMTVNDNHDIGERDDVITDAMILSAVQAVA